jgi:hypothetical protein
MTTSTPGAGLKVAAAAALALTLASAPSRADDDKESSGRLITWNVSKDGAGEVLGSETLRLVEGSSGTLFASGETKLKSGKKVHRKSHLQRDAGGRLMKYQRVEAGLKGAGLRLFEWQGQMRIAPINAAGKPADVGALASARIWDEELWHLYQTWGLPKSCESARLAYFDPGRRVAGEATLSCSGRRTVYDKAKGVAVHRFEVGGVPGEAVELWVDGDGTLVGAKSASRLMLKADFALEPGKGAGDKGAGEDDSEKEVIKDRGVGE